MLISKEKFVEYIKAIKYTEKFQTEAVNLIHKYNPYSLTSILDFPSCEDELIELLEIVTEDSGYISFFCYELNFGKSWKSGMITDDNGNDIPLGTIDDLWNLLCNQQ